jgi:hypothetical protein
MHELNRCSDGCFGCKEATRNVLRSCFVLVRLRERRIAVSSN